MSSQRDGLRLVQLRGGGDCLRACVATVLELELDDVSVANGSLDHNGALRVEAEWREWAAGRGLALHSSPLYAPTYLPAWIAIVAMPWGEAHALVMQHDRLLYDPATAPGSPQQTIDQRAVIGSLIVGAPEWVAAQQRRMEVFAHTDPERVWFLGAYGEFTRQMLHQGGH
jgi:hypothetical protein